MSKDDPIAKFKAACRPESKFIHLNNAGIAPICKPARDSIKAWADRMHLEGTYAISDLVLAQEAARTHLAKIFNSKPEQVAFFQGAANAISQMAFGLALQPGDEVIVWDQEYPSNFYPWRDAVHAAGGKLVIAESGPGLSTPVEHLIENVTERTRVIAISWVQYQTGAITDLERISAFARAKGILTFADVIQGAGCLPLDFSASGIDAIVGGSHKWMLSPLGVGYLIARPEIFEQLKPQAVGAMTYGTSEDLANVEAVIRTGFARFEPGSRPMLDIAAFGKTLELFLETGIDRIAQEAEWLAKKLLHGVRERGYEIQTPHGAHHRGAILNFKPTSGAKHKSLSVVEAALKEKRISFASRAGGIRLSPHAFNTIDDLETVWSAL